MSCTCTLSFYHPFYHPLCYFLTLPCCVRSCMLHTAKIALRRHLLHHACSTRSDMHRHLREQAHIPRHVLRLWKMDGGRFSMPRRTSSSSRCVDSLLRATTRRIVNEAFISAVQEMWRGFTTGACLQIYVLLCVCPSAAQMVHAQLRLQSNPMGYLTVECRPQQTLCAKGPATTVKAV